MIESFFECGDFNRFVDCFVKEFCEGSLQLRRAAGFEPLPALVAPILAFTIAAFLNEFQKFAVGHRRASNAKGFDFDLVRPLLIVEDKRRLLGSTDHEFAAGNFHVA
jgi:hypothetical protein